MLPALLVTLALPFAALAEPQQIRSVEDPILHYYLQAYSGNNTLATVGPETTSEYFTVNGTIQSTNSSLYLNVGNDTTSYKTLTFGAAATMSEWTLEGDTIVTAETSIYGRQLNFLACELDADYWQVYLQTGSDTPASGTCSNYQTLHLPCIC
ncbi:hypothetical protein M406DRAFT_73207 [Cryphonectria parasitica EP155]|uniref:Uncharacterized protein n=1 Tax=Cryphonectria parasitica (strain ATCC 38755 / EP155) TaxID=660469 RepID=A0A9P4XTS5_CRYP1|nr:uncharacterized protein M406DRAFT_73207 [Cryphonectria parasitica EP155]KAF3760741.1 hypothetical protein M406DRAFT_73207 [Cryphonectria parasitica EP155]